MAQYGQAADSGGVKTAPETVQQVIAALYSNATDCPVLAGGSVTGRADMAYQVSAGVGLVQSAAGACYVTWDAQQTGLTTPPPSGSATDCIYVDADGVVRMTRGTPPAGVCVLDKRTVPAAATSTTGTTSVHNRVWALSRGQGPTKIAEYMDPTVSGWARSERFKWATAGFATAYDYDLRIVVDWNLAVRNAGELGGPEQNPVGSFGLDLYLDGQKVGFRELEYTRIFMQRSTTFYLPDVPAGPHTIEAYRWHFFGLEALHHGNGHSRLAVYRDSMRA